MEIVSGHKQASHNARCTNAPVPGETFDIQPNCESGVRGGEEETLQVLKKQRNS